MFSFFFLLKKDLKKINYRKKKDIYIYSLKGKKKKEIRNLKKKKEYVSMYILK